MSTTNTYVIARDTSSCLVSALRVCQTCPRRLFQLRACWCSEREGVAAFFLPSVRHGQINDILLPREQQQEMSSWLWLL